WHTRKRTSSRSSLYSSKPCNSLPSSRNSSPKLYNGSVCLKPPPKRWLVRILLWTRWQQASQNLITTLAQTTLSKSGFHATKTSSTLKPLSSMMQRAFGCCYASYGQMYT
ncbi:hypothetical protein M513_14358, partial [Trichuris suis]